MEAYKERFIEEYKQLKTRLNKLDAIIDGYDNGTLNFTPTCDIDLLREQSFYMKGYLKILERRSRVERIILPEV